MTLPVWPYPLPLPQRSGYGEKTQPRVERLQMASGRHRQWLASSAMDKQLSVEWLFDDEQRGIFEDFYFHQVRAVGWFLMPLPIRGAYENGLNDGRVRMVGGQLSSRLDGAHWRVSTTLEIENINRYSMTELFAQQHRMAYLDFITELESSIHRLNTKPEIQQ